MFVVIDIVKMIYEANKEEREKHRREENVFWVTDLVGALLRGFTRWSILNYQLRRFSHPHLF